MAQPSSPGTTERIQSTQPGTLRQNLRDLKVAEATVQLENLAREAGIAPSTWTEVPLGQCEGQIVVAFRDLKTAYQKLRSELSGAIDRIAVLHAALKQAPDDFQYPRNAFTLDKLQARPTFIDDNLENARSEDVERLRTEFDAPARLGNFQPLMSKARELLDGPATP